METERINSDNGIQEHTSGRESHSIETDRAERSSSIRDELERQFDAHRGDETREERQSESSVRDELRRQFAREGHEEQTHEREEQTQTEQAQRQHNDANVGTQTQPPTTWAPDARNTWAQVPPAAQQAVIKREQDIQRGVQQLRQHYNEIDQAIAPYDQAIKNFGKTRGQFVAQLGAWFNALTNNPVQAFPDLIRSYAATLQQSGYDVNNLLSVWDPRQSPQVATNQAYHQIYQQGFQQAQQQFEADYQRQLYQQQEQNTQMALANWATDKPHFEEVRHLMGTILASAAERGQLPVLPNGQINLAYVYEQACMATPNIRNKMLRDQQRAAAKVDQDRVNRSRRAAVSISPSAPRGIELSRGSKANGASRKSVRESLMEAIQEHSA